MSRSDWKDRFSDKQLERKRLSDKISQRRARQQAKRNTTELEYRLQLLVDGETATLTNHIQQENASLRTKLWRYRHRMESMFLQSKQCLMQDDESWAALHAPILTQSPKADSIDEGNPATTPKTGQDLEVTSYHEVDQKCLAKLYKFLPSFFAELAPLMGVAGHVHDQWAANEILEAMMMWKAKLGLKEDEFAVLFVSLNLDQEPFNLTPEKVKEQALSKHLFQDIMQNLLYGEEPIPRHIHKDDMIPEEELSKMQYQRRAIAYCTYETIGAWRDCFKSALEYAAMFWAQYRFFMVIAFPTLENYLKCPVWRRPIPEQFNHDHPSIIDFIVWPEIREVLVRNWHQYDLPRLCVSLVRSFEFKGVQMDIATAIRLQSDSCDVVLEETFEREINDIHNLTVGSTPFTLRYPELAAAMFLEPKLPPDSVAAISNESSEPQPWSSTESMGLTGMDPNGSTINCAMDEWGSIDWCLQSNPVQDLQAIPAALCGSWNPEDGMAAVTPYLSGLPLPLSNGFPSVVKHS